MRQEPIEIKLSGLGNSPDDKQSADGNLALAFNVIHEEGSLRPAHETAPDILREMDTDQYVLYQHHNDNYTKFIYKDSDKTYGWFDNTSRMFSPMYQIDPSPMTRMSARSAVPDDGNNTPEVPDEIHPTSRILSGLNVFSVNDGVETPIEGMSFNGIPTTLKIKSVFFSNLSTRIGLVNITYILSVNGKETARETKPVFETSECEETFEVSVGSQDTINIKTLLSWANELGQAKTDSHSRSFTCHTGEGTTIDEIDFDSTGTTIAPKISGEFSEVPADSARNIIAIGNMLVFFTENETYYYKWNGVDYIFKGTKFPEIRIKFGLKAHKYQASDHIIGFTKKNISVGSTIPDEIVNEYYKLPTVSISERILDRNTDNPDSDEDSDSDQTFKTEDIEHVTTGVMGEVNRFTNEWCGEHGYFSQPFLVRAAYRLFDSRTTMDTAPVLMIPASGCNPMVNVMMIRKTSLYLDTTGIGCSLTYTIDFGFKKELEDWEDIIKGLDIFVSSPMYTYNPDGQCKKMVKPSWVSSHVESQLTASNHLDGKYSISKGDGLVGYEKRSMVSFFDDGDVAGTNLSYQDRFIVRGSKKLAVWAKSGNISRTLVNAYTMSGQAFDPTSYIQLPTRDADDINDRIRECNTFHLIKSLSKEDITTDIFGTEINLSHGKISNLETKEAMTFEYDSHHKLIPNHVASYNNRLNIANVDKYFFEGFPLSSMLPRCEDSMVEASYVFVCLRNSSYESVKMVKDTYTVSPLIMRSFLYYPDPDAYQIIVGIKHRTDGYKLMKLPLSEHKGINASVYFNGLDDLTASWDVIGSEAKSQIEEYIAKANIAETPQHLQNTIYTSEPANPFVFKSSNVEDVSQGKIVALAPATMPLTQGQYDYADMYCFTTDGIWALSTNETGGWKSKKAFSYDSLLNDKPSNILRMQRDVVFASMRGLMILSGNNTECITEIFDGASDEVLNGNAVLPLSGRTVLNHLKTFILPLVWKEKFSYLASADLYRNFKEFIKNAVMLYDYTHQRIIVGNPDYDFSFVFALKDKLWSCITMRILSAVNSYPDCYAMVYDKANERNCLVNFSDDRDKGQITIIPNEGILLSRPIKLSQPSILKTLRTINVTGQFEKRNVDMVLYGSNDNRLTRWHIVNSSKGGRMSFKFGSPYKAFRIAVISRLDKGESIDGITLDFENKNTNKLRQ